jgi:hypothetical protein
MSVLQTCLFQLVGNSSKYLIKLSVFVHHSVFKIVTSDFHTTKNGIPEIITLQIARLKDGVTLNFKEIEPFAIAGIFVAFYDQWQWWNKNYMKFHTLAI